MRPPSADADAKTASLFTLTLARRYLDAKDRRAKHTATPAALEHEVAETAAAAAATAGSEPWRCVLLDAAVQRASRKRKGKPR